MPEIYRDSDIMLETLSMYKVLQGLIHNINTPLNVIIGYAQQMQKQNPELKYLQSISDAGLQIDDLIQSSSRQFMQRLNPDPTVFDARLWMSDEMLILKNVLEIKHQFRLEANLPEANIAVHSNPYLLSAFVEGLVLFVRKYAEILPGSKYIQFSLENDPTHAILSVRLPESDIWQDNMESYLYHLQEYLESVSGFPFQPDYPFEWHFLNSKEVRISLNKAGKA